jgi:hypothetical protein
MLRPCTTKLSCCMHSHLDLLLATIQSQSLPVNCWAEINPIITHSSDSFYCFWKFGILNWFCSRRRTVIIIFYSRSLSVDCTNQLILGSAFWFFVDLALQMVNGCPNKVCTTKQKTRVVLLKKPKMCMWLGAEKDWKLWIRFLFLSLCSLTAPRSHDCLPALMSWGGRRLLPGVLSSWFFQSFTYTHIVGIDTFPCSFWTTIGVSRY